VPRLIILLKSVLRIQFTICTLQKDLKGYVLKSELDFLMLGVNVKTVIFSTVAMFVFAACERGYSVFVRNTSPTPLFVKTYPSIESFFYSVHSSYYDSILVRKVRTENNISVYKIDKYEKFLVWAYLDKKPMVNEFPFDYIALFSGSDSIVLDSKLKIIEAVKQDGGKKRNFYLEINK